MPTWKEAGFSLVYRRKRVLTSLGLQGKILRGLSTIPAQGASSLKQPSLWKQICFPAITQKGFKDISLTRMFFLMVSLATCEFNDILWHIFFLLRPMSFYLHIHRTVSTDNVQAKDRLLPLVSTRWDPLAPSISLCGPVWGPV